MGWDLRLTHLARRTSTLLLKGTMWLAPSAVGAADAGPFQGRYWMQPTCTRTARTGSACVSMPVNGNIPNDGLLCFATELPKPGDGLCSRPTERTQAPAPETMYLSSAGRSSDALCTQMGKEPASHLYQEVGLAAGATTCPHAEAMMHVT